MRYSKTGDPYVTGLAYVVARALYLDGRVRAEPHKLRQRELDEIRTLVDKLAEFFPESTISEAFDMAHDHNEWSLRPRGERR